MDPFIYNTITQSGSGEYKDRGSRFIGFALPFPKEEKLRNILSQIKQEYPKARHYCYAYRTGTDGSIFRTNDDGEPSGTAGGPILGQIDHFELSEVLIVVVRYFGGTLLGVRGLIEAYRAAAFEAIQATAIIVKDKTRKFSLHFEYRQMNEIMQILKQLDITIVNREMMDSCKFIIEIPLRNLKNAVDKLGRIYTMECREL